MTPAYGWDQAIFRCGRCGIEHTATYASLAGALAAARRTITRIHAQADQKEQ